jgi:RimJ/RimL family protein N-acetyltransferase
MVRLRTVDATLRAEVLGLSPAPEDVRFSGAGADVLPAAERHATRAAVAIVRDGQAVGFLALDPADPICAYAAPAPSVALRAFFVDERFQRQGVARAALRRLPGFVRDGYPEAEIVVLTVNVTNPVAMGVYRRAGFEDTGRLHLTGVHGPQHVLVLALR